MRKVPKVRLADPDVEPTDEELEALMEAVGERVREDYARAHKRLQDSFYSFRYDPDKKK